ncbi:MAG: hypothetical protein IPN69_08055 [Acidobacteria bacterium]|nr:hypothetical protein [Acidobacteriota bacterium]
MERKSCWNCALKTVCALNKAIKDLAPLFFQSATFEGKVREEIARYCANYIRIDEGVPILESVKSGADKATKQ